jgi:tetratricopeptide (TPR) repeat protein
MAVAVVLIVVPLLTVANLIPIYRAAADRYLYLPMAGVGLAAGLLLDAPWLANRERLRERLLLGCAAAVVLLAAACMERQKVWANSLALWTDTFRKNPVAYTGASGLAEALREADRLPEAEATARRAIELSDGKRGDVWATLALILDGQGRTAEAFAALDKAMETDPKLADPDSRVAVMAMERPYADDLKSLQARRKALP